MTPTGVTAFVHEALVDMVDGNDAAAVGASVTVALCGHWEHPPPCPVAPHHTAVEAADDALRVRVLFVGERDSESDIRQLIDTGLRTGSLVGPDGSASRWQVRSSGAGTVLPEEQAHAARLASAAPD